MSPQNSCYEPEYQQALSLFNEGRFFESHEALEGLWLRLPKGPEKLFYQAIIQIAAAFLHRSGHRVRPAVSLYRRSREKLISLEQEQFLGLELKTLVATLDTCFLPLEAGVPPADWPPPPRIELT